MKIGFVLDDTLDTTDGVQQYVLLVGGWLKRQGHDVHYLVGHSTRKDVDNIHSLARNVRVSFNKNRLSVPLPASTRAIKNLLNAEKFDVLHIQMPFSPFLAGKIIRHAPIETAIVGTFHVAPHGKNVTFGTRVLAMVQRANIEKIDRIMSVSQVAKQFALNTQNIKSTVVPNAIDTKMWQSSKVVKRKYDIVFVGRLVSRKGCIYLLRALKSLANLQDISKLKVAIVGDGPEREVLEQYAKVNNLSRICTFEGYVSEDKKKQILRSSKLAVFPSTGGESFGIVLIEAMAAGTTVLAGNNPGYNTVLGALPEVLFTPQNIKELADSLFTMLNDQATLNMIHAAQQKILKRYDIDIVGNAILKIYKEAIASK